MKLKQWENIFQMIENVSSIVQFAIQIKNRIMKHVNVSVKIMVYAKKIVVGILADEFVRIASIYKSIADASLIVCEKFISVMDIVSTKMTNIIAANVSINIYDTKVRYKIDCLFCI